MSTRSSARNIFPLLDNLELEIRRRSRTDPTLLNDFEMVAEENGDLPVPDLRTMEELCQPSLNGQGRPIAPIAIQATNFGLKNDLIQQVSNSCQFHSLPGGTFMKRRPEECYDLIENMTAYHSDWDTSAQRSESSSSITSSFDTEITALKAEMTEINKNLMRVLQVNQQVKVVTPNCKTCGGPHSFNDCPTTIGNTQNVYAAGAYQGNPYQPQGNRNLLSYRSDNYLGPPGFNQNQNCNNQNQNFHNQNRNQGNHHPHGNNQRRNQFFQGASHGQNPPLAYQAPVYQLQIPQPQVVTTNKFTNFMKANNAILKNMQTNITSLTNSNLELKNMFGKFMKMNTASSLSLGTLPGNIITNSKEELKGITTRSGTAYQGPTFPTTSSSLPPVVECETEATKDKPVVAPISGLKPNQRPSIPYPSRLHDQKLHDKANDQREKFIQIFKDLNFNISFADALILMPKFGPTIKTLLTNKDKLSELARTPLNEHCSTILLKKLPEKLGDPKKFLIPCDFPGMAECLALADLGYFFLKTGRALIDVFEGELTLRVVKEAITFNIDQTSRYSANYNDMTANRIDVIDMDCEEYSDFLLEEVDAFQALEDDPTSPEVDQSYVDTEGDILLLEAFLNDDSSLTPPNQGNYPPQDLHPHLEYAFLERNDKLPVIIAKDLSNEEKTALITVLKSHKRAITWKLSDIKERILKRCEDTDLCLNWEKSHFMVKEGIVLSHKISKEGIEVDEAKVNVIDKLPHPTTVKGICSFLGHAGFYRRFIKVFRR
nr:hypothetical protein [Tanacetum cinerariifolium]